MWQRILVIASMVLAPSAWAQPTPAPSPAPSQADLDLVRGEIARVREGATDRMEGDEAAIAHLYELLAEERAAREAAERDAREARLLTASTPTVHSGRLNLWISGFLQFDAVAWNQQSQDQLDPSTGAPLNQTRFFVRRARLRAEIDYKIIGGAVEFDGNTVNGYQARIIGAEVSLKWRSGDPLVPYLQLTAGSFKIPFGFEVQQRDTDRLFLERSTMERAFFTGEYDLGAKLFGGWRFLRYSVAVMNGDPIGEKDFPGRDPNQSKDVLGKLGAELAVGRVAVAGDFSGLWGTGFHKGTPTTKATLVWRDTNQDGAVQTNELTAIPGQVALPSQNFGRWAVGGDLRLTLRTRLGETLLYGELTYATNLDRFLVVADPVAANRDLRELGFYGGLVQELTPWAAVGVRYDYYDPDRDANDLRTGVQVPRDASYSTLAVVAALRFPGYARLLAEYDHSTNALGRTPEGFVTTLAADAFTLRAEVKF